MGLNDIPSSQRPHISFFGKVNAGKSSVVNAVTGQNLSIVSEKLGTTTDPVSKAMEILPLGPVVIIDTPGFNDDSDLGIQRIERTRQVLKRTDIAVLVVDSSLECAMDDCNMELISLFKEHEIPYIIAYNKSDIKGNISLPSDNCISVSALTGQGIFELKEKLANFAKKAEIKNFIVKDLIKKEDLVVLVIPIDESAPKGRIILPQQNVLREVLDANATALCVQDTEYASLLASLKKNPALVITDSQAFKQVSADTPDDVLLTSFSILMARYKGFLEPALKGIASIKDLKNGSTVLISEGCTHHRQCNDIGTVKLPRWLKEFTNKDLNIRTTSGNDFPSDLTGIDLIIHCGACMLNSKEMQSRTKSATAQNVPITNYGTIIAYFNRILERSLDVLPEYKSIII